MSGHPEDPPLPVISDSEVREDDVPVLRGGEPSLPRIIIPARRTVVEEAPASKPEEGLRIESRFYSGGAAAERMAGAGKLDVTELGKSVVRLDSELSVAAAARQDQLPVMQPRQRKAATETQIASEWGTTHRKHSHSWMIWAGLGLVGIVIGFLALQLKPASKEEEVRVSHLRSIKVVDDVVDVDDPMVYFKENAGEVSQQMQATLVAYAKARTVEDLVPLVRHGADLKDALKKHWKSWEAPANWQPGSDLNVAFDSVGSLPYGVIVGTGPDFSSYQVLLVRENDRMIIDWEATTGYNPLSFDELSSPSVKEGTVRATAQSTAFYTEQFPETDYQSYRLAEAGSDSVLWGYVKKGTAAAVSMDKIFRAGVILDERPPDQRLRVRLGRGPEGAWPNQWLITDVLHKGWVTP